MRRVLLDTSLVIRAFDPKAQDAPELIASAKEKMKALVNDPTVALAITPLIYFEALRAVEYGDIQRSQNSKARCLNLTWWKFAKERRTWLCA